MSAKAIAEILAGSDRLPRETQEMVNAESSRFIGRSMQRREDRRLLTGRGQFIADLTLPGMLHAVFVRSQIAHGRIRSIDVARAAAMPRVAHLLTRADLLRIF